MTDPWLIQRKSGTDGFTYRRVGYGPDYEFTYDDVTKQFDYFRGYISKESQQRVSKTQAKDQYDEIVTKHNYATRVPLPSFFPTLLDVRQLFRRHIVPSFLCCNRFPAHVLWFGCGR